MQGRTEMSGSNTLTRQDVEAGITNFLAKYFGGMSTCEFRKAVASGSIDRRDVSIREVLAWMDGFA